MAMALQIFSMVYTNKDSGSFKAGVVSMMRFRERYCVHVLSIQGNHTQSSSQGAVKISIRRSSLLKIVHRRTHGWTPHYLLIGFTHYLCPGAVKHLNKEGFHIVTYLC